MVLTYIYAMLNKRNGYVKIGRSDNPVFREKTLQSEEPEVVLLFAHLCPPEIEVRMHREYAEMRLRGEWFNLTNENIVDLEEQIREASTESLSPFIENEFCSIYSAYMREMDEEIAKAQEFYRENPQMVPKDGSDFIQ